MELKLYNTLAREKQVFQPIDPAHVRVYACGPTVYSYAHIGNARMAVVFDVLVRLLRRIYPNVTYVSNITDIEDKIIIAARESGTAINDVTEKFHRIYNEDMAILGVSTPDVQPLATTHVAEMIALIGALVQNGHAYANDGHVLFNVPSYPAYGRLSGRSRDDQIAGARVEIAPYKKDPADFVLWKPSNGDEPGWDSPWGFGRPGWHIECSAMAEKHLGLPFDIHGGGADLKFPHHENEIAQSCCAHDLSPEEFARTWVHNGFVTVNGEKMSKSLGNTLLAHDLIMDHSGEVLRLALLSAQYRQPLDWSDQIVHQAQKLLDRGYKMLQEAGEVAATDVPPAVLDALCDDLNTPAVLAALNAFMKDEADPAKRAGGLKAAGNLLGIFQQDPAEWFAAEAVGEGDVARIEALLVERTAAKKEKNFARADEIRDQLAGEGIVIEDTPAGTVWRKA